MLGYIFGGIKSQLVVICLLCAILFRSGTCTFDKLRPNFDHDGDPTKCMDQGLQEVHGQHLDPVLQDQ